MFLLIPILFVSCGSDDTPPASPPPQQSPQTPAEVTWATVHEEFNTDLRAPDDCDFPLEFTVRSDGSFTAGPCTPGDALKTGHITASESANLSTLANAVTSGDLRTQTCSSIGFLTADIVDLTLSDGSVWRVKDVTPEHSCFRDGQQNVTSFADFLNSLLLKYYPKRPIPEPTNGGA